MNNKSNNVKDLGTFALSSNQDIRLLAKMLVEKNKSNSYYKSPLISDEEKAKQA